ncbi:MAG: DUF192 domain-containing protein [Acaryochloridaceae cyanobacterium CSU_3_4]|nr:DUF192 domain-containing protein [Acaryochloris sp. SU_5_25]NJN38628.1 DUF192 domain-containing protein [Acaryochloridaceae cyanobacterium CSU_3_4]
MFTENPSHLHPWLPWLGVVAGVLMLGCQPLPSSTATDAAPSPPSVKPAMTVPSAPGQRLPITAEAIIKNQLVALEVAQTPQQQAIGLMGRNILGDNQGMLFPFDPPRSVSFWMKNVWIDLDMIFLRKGKVFAIEHRVPPCQNTPCPTYGPKGATIDQVIELRGGRAAELGIQVGDRISIQSLSPNPGVRAR